MISVPAMPPRRIGLIANTEKPGAAELVHALRAGFRRHGIVPGCERRTAQLAGLPDGEEIRSLAARSELLVVLGGDGTILQALHEIGTCDCPIFGINLGTLGFLTAAGATAVEEAIESIAARNFLLSKRTMLAVSVQRGETVLHTRFALNDAVLSRGERSRLVRLSVKIDGMPLTEYNADGLVVSTPTGSTAYSLSAGGPVLAPDSGVWVITPICPHVLTNRSVIVSDASVIALAAAAGQEDVFLTLDGRSSTRVEPGDTVCLRKASQQISLAMPPGMTFFEVLRQKLKWSGAAV